MSKKQTHVFMEEHNGIDKRFEMHFPHDLCAYIDYDDVNHPAFGYPLCLFSL